jgi:integrase
MNMAANNPDMLSNYADHELEGLVLRWLSEIEQHAKAAPAKRAAWLKREGIEDFPQGHDELEEALDTLTYDVQRAHEEAIGFSNEEIHYGMDAAAKFLRKRVVTFNPNSETFIQLGKMISKTIHAMALHRLQTMQGNPYTSPDSIFARHLHGGALHAVSGIPPEAKRTLQQVIDEFMEDPEIIQGKSTRKKSIIIVRTLKELLSADKFVHEITRTDVKQIRELLRKIPAHATKHAPGKTLKEAAVLAAQHHWPLLSNATINMYLDKLSAVLNFARKEKYTLENVAEGIQVKDNVQKKDKRKPFDANQLNDIFSAPLYTGCKNGERGYNITGAARPKNARFWIPLIALFTGMRLNEICQLYVTDITVQNGVDVILIATEDMGNSGEDTDKHVKTQSSVRFIPIHPELKKIGFMVFVAEAKEAQQKNLSSSLRQ